ncbi:MAG: hypothetical protein KDD21_02440, partial [Bacteroidetes bacterium]|nr:hypothetical protein [Bacteroidota bacterium]
MFDISPQLNRKFILISLLGSIAYILLLNLTFGTYFSSYEIMFNAVFSKTFIGDMHYDWISNEWFYFAQLILRISEAFKQLHVYSLLFTLINLYGLFALFYCIQISLAKEKCKNIFLLFLFMVLLFNSTFIEVNNRSITILLCFTSMFNVYLYKYVYKNKLLLFLSISLLFIGLTLRFE